MTSFNSDSVVKILYFASHTTATSAICWYLSLNPQNWPPLSVPQIRENVLIGWLVLCWPMGVLPKLEPFVQTNRSVFPNLRQLKTKSSKIKLEEKPFSATEKWSGCIKNTSRSYLTYVGGLIHWKTWVATNFQWAEALQRFCSRSQGVATAVSVFVKLNQNNYKYWDGNVVYEI